MIRRPGAAALLPALLAACGLGPGGADVPELRPSDGLLERTDLQQVVEAQVRRDTPALIDRLRSGDPAVRARAAFALGSVQGRAAVPALVALLDDTARAVRRDAAFALGQMGDTTVQEPLLAAFGGETAPEVRARLLEALGKSGGGGALERLTARPRGPMWEARTLAMSRLVLAGRRHPPALDSLTAWLRADDPGVRLQAARTFARSPDPRVWGGRWSAIREALGSYDLADPAAMHLVSLVGRMREAEDTGRLLRWLQAARDWRVRTNAALALQDREVVAEVQDALVEALDDPSVHVRSSAAGVLAASPQPPEVLEQVEAWLRANPRDWAPAGPLLRLLAIAGRDEAVLEWVDRWDPGQPGPWGVALPALTVLEHPAALDRLERAATAGDPLLATGAVRALRHRWFVDKARPANHPRYWSIVSEAARRDDPRVAAAVAPVLDDPAFLGRGSGPLLVEMWRGLDPAGAPLAAQLEVLGALASTGLPEAVPVLTEALGHPRVEVRDSAAAALTALASDSQGGASGGPGPADTVSPPGPTRPPDTAAAGRLDWELLRRLGPGPRLILETEEGAVEVTLVPEEAPLTVQTLARLAREARFDGVPFHRVVPNFVVQGGDVEAGDGSGGPGFTIPSEFTSLAFLRGTAGMASSGKDTEGSQFFLTHGPQPHLDGAYTAFGWVSSGMEVVDRIVQGQRILRARVAGASAADAPDTAGRPG